MWVDGDPRFNGPQTTESWSTERKSMGSRSSGTQGWQCQPGPPSVLDEKPPADRLLCDLDRKHNLAVSDWPPNWRCVSRALTYIETHYCERVYACDIAKAVGLSESRLKALFQSTLQMPWTQYLQAYRVQEAINLIVSGQCNISEAATAVGFKSLSHFNVTFRALQGSSPSEYLKTLLVGVDKPHIG